MLDREGYSLNQENSCEKKLHILVDSFYWSISHWDYLMPSTGMTILIKGNIKTGMIADLILLDGNPIEDIRNTKGIFSVMANGIFYDRKALDNVLKNVEIEVGK